MTPDTVHDTNIRVPLLSRQHLCGVENRTWERKPKINPRHHNDLTAGVLVL